SARESGQANTASSSALPAILRRMSRMSLPRRGRKKRSCRRGGVECFAWGKSPALMGGGFGRRPQHLPRRPPPLPARPGCPPVPPCPKLRIGWEGDVLGLHGGIDRDPRQIPRPQRPTLVRHPQALGQEKFQLAAEALAPMAQVRALVRKLVLEELLSGEVLEVWIIDPAF